MPEQKQARAKAKTPTLDPEIRRDITAEIVNSPAHHRALRRSNAAWFDQSGMTRTGRNTWC
ncbi:hypothetical protein [Verrucomicrobium spinosum]|uniref:hypothetical protein n=1 Tax=Verrucomicrobium spinosum TaxID=2736 RepID=UPI000AC2A542|nr:hypothetical protein [Verrucomicrobium spinosum]